MKPETSETSLRAAQQISNFETSVSKSIKLMNEMGFRVEFPEDAEQELKKLRSNAIDLQRNFQKSEKARMFAEEEIKKLHDQLVELEQEEATQHYRVTDLDKQIEVKKKEIDRVESKIQQIKSHGEQRISELNQGFEEMRAKYAQQRDDLIKQERLLIRKLRDLTREKDHYMDAIEDASLKRAEGDLEVKNLSHGIDDLRNEITMLQGQIDAQRKDRQSLQRIWETKNSRAEQELASIADATNEKYRRQEQEIRELQGQVEQAQYHLDKQIAEKQQLTDELISRRSHANEIIENRVSQMQEDLVQKFKNDVSVARRLISVRDNLLNESNPDPNATRLSAPAAWRPSDRLSQAAAVNEIIRGRSSF